MAAAVRGPTANRILFSQPVSPVPGNALLNASTARGLVKISPAYRSGCFRNLYSSSCFAYSNLSTGRVCVSKPASQRAFSQAQDVSRPGISSEGSSPERSKSTVFLITHPDCGAPSGCACPPAPAARLRVRRPWFHLRRRDPFAARGRFVCRPAMPRIPRG